VAGRRGLLGAGTGALLSVPPWALRAWVRRLVAPWVQAPATWSAMRSRTRKSPRDSRRVKSQYQQRELQSQRHQIQQLQSETGDRSDQGSAAVDIIRS